MKDIHQLYREGHPIARIAAMTGIPQSTVRYRLTLADQRKKSDTRKTPRACMCCGTQFMSDGPHNRLCTECRRISVTQEELYWCDPPENRGRGGQ